jgi:hypothetical protein
MKQSRNYFLFFGLVIPLISSLSSLLFVSNEPRELIQRDYEYISKASSFTHTEFDLILNDPMDYQLEFVKNSPHVLAVQPVYRYNASITRASNGITSNSFLTNALFIDNFDELEITQFSQNRLLRSLDSNPSQFIYVDRLVADGLNLSLNDEIELSFSSFDVTMTFVISRIYEVDYFITNQTKRGSVFFSFSGDYKTLIEDNVGDDLSLDYFYVKTSNTQLARQYFETNYDPEGRMLTLDWFGGNLNAYNDHVTSFRAATYPQDVSSKKDIQDLTIFENRNELDQDIQSLPNRISQNFNLYLISGLIGFQIISFLMLFFYKIIVNKSRLFLMTSLIGSFIFLSLFSLFNYLSYTSQFVFNPLQSSLILQLNPLLWILMPFLWGNLTLLVLSGIWYFILNSKKYQNQYRRF